jgi:hypothetical protein
MSRPLMRLKNKPSQRNRTVYGRCGRRLTCAYVERTGFRNLFGRQEWLGPRIYQRMRHSSLTRLHRTEGLVSP